MSTAVSDLTELLRTMRPTLNAGTYVFAVLTPGADARDLDPIATFREREALTLIVEEHEAEATGLNVLFRAAWITLNVHSDLAAVGLTAAVSTALARKGISCNVVAAAHHDHLFVPVESAGDALDTLNALQAASGASCA